MILLISNIYLSIYIYEIYKGLRENGEEIYICNCMYPLLMGSQIVCLFCQGLLLLARKCFHESWGPLERVSDGMHKPTRITVFLVHFQLPNTIAAAGMARAQPNHFLLNLTYLLLCLVEITFSIAASIERRVGEHDNRLLLAGHRPTRPWVPAPPVWFGFHFLHLDAKARGHGHNNI